ncbi:MAG TPA: small multi-drug export protein [Lentisphaeria bacterium]|nr:small multi-drug export protein [Lentisphaeria bacterium]
MPWFERLVMRYIERARAKLKPQVDKYGAIGLAIFIGIPLPLTGAYTGAAGAFALGMERRQFMLANVVGVLIAAVLVTIITLLIRAGINLPIFDILIKA